VQEGSHLFTTSGIILLSRSFGEGHRLVTIMSEGYGRIDATGFGAGKPGSRLVSKLEPFTVGEMVLEKAGHDRPYRLREIDVSTSNHGLREDLSRYLVAHAMVEPYIRFVEGAHRDEDLYHLLAESLHLLGVCADYRKGMALLTGFDVHFLTRMGYRPELKVCAACGGGLEGGAFADPERGFPLCGNCRRAESVAAKEGALEFICWVLGRSLSDSLRAAVRDDTMRSLRSIVECIYGSIFSRRIKSWDFLGLTTGQ
jgi:DNA repair protein RecO (recombination protein O)